MKKRIIALILAVTTIFGMLTVPTSAAGLSTSGTLANSSTVTIQMDGSGGFLNKSTGGNIVGGYWKYTSNDGLTGSAYCVNWGLTGVSPSKSLSIQEYNRNPQTMGVFAGGYPNRTLEQFKELHTDDVRGVAGLTETEYKYATQVAIWASCGQISVPGTTFTAGRTSLVEPTADAQGIRIFDSVKALLYAAQFWDKHLYTGMSVRAEENTDVRAVEIINELGLEGAAEDGTDGIKKETINGKEYYTRVMYVASATSTWIDGRTTKIYSTDAPAGTIFTAENGSPLETVQENGATCYKVDTSASHNTNLNSNGSEFYGTFKVCIPVDNAAEEGSFTIKARGGVAQYNLYLANNPSASEQSYIISDPGYITLDASATFSWKGMGDPDDTAKLQIVKAGPGGSPLEGAEFTLTGDKGTVVTGTSDRNGQVMWTDLPASEKFTLTETVAPEGCQVISPINVTLNAGRTTYLTVPNDSEKGFTVKKVDAQNKASLQGAVFRFEQIDGSYVTTGTTGFDGQISFEGDELPYGSYRVVEQSPPEGYLKDTHVETVEWTGEKDVLLTFENVREIRVLIVKKNENNVSLGGATFDIYGDGKYLTSVTTNDAGEAYVTGIKAEMYIEAVETIAPKGHILDSTPHGIHINPYNPAIEDDPVLTIVNQTKVSLRIIKYDRQSKAKLPNVTFEIYKDGELFDTKTTPESGMIELFDLEPGTYLVKEVSTDDSHIVDVTPQQIELKAGQTATQELVFFNDTLPGMHLIKVDSADLSKTIPNVRFKFEAVNGSWGPIELTTGPDGTIDLSKLPTGAVVVTELECPGYVVDDAQRIIELKPNETAQFVFTNTKKPGFKLVKTSADGTPLDGVTFRIAKIEDGSRYLDRTTANGGEIFVEDLEPGMWSVTEIATLPDHVLDTTEHHVELFPNKTSELRLSNDKKPLLTLAKIDADSGVPIPNTVFTVKALDGTYQDDWKTGPDGKVSQIVDPGVYEVTEKSVPAPYYLPDKDADRTQTITLSPNDKKTLTFRNRKAPELTIFKENSITGEAIEHAKFHITYTSNGEAAEAPATIDYGEVFTDSRGEIKVHELGKRLYPGEFTITEVEPADGFQLKEPLTQTVIIHGNESKTVRFQNTPLSALVVWKYDSVTGAPVEGAIFQVRYMSGTSGSGGTVIGTYKTGPGGSFTVNRLKAGAYLVEELASDGDHVMDTAPQTAYISGKEQDVVQLYFGNSPKGAVLIKKIDSVTHEPLSDCEFFITDSHGTMIGDANGKFVTDSAGTILISNIDPGTTIVAREARAKENYILDDVPQTATIKAGQTVTLEFRNQPKGSVTLYKFSSVDRKTPLEGVGFKITYADGKVVDNIGGKLSSNGIYYTDSEGQINISGVTGTLIFTEVSTIPGYLIDENRKSQTIVVNPDDHQSVYFYNQPVGSILVKKMSSTTKEPLSDVIIRITRTDGSVVGTSNGEFRTDENGFIKVDVEPGSYIVQEVSAKPGFLLDDTPKVVEVKGSGVYNVELFNQPLGSLVIHKYSSLDRKTPLAGVQFKVTYAPGCVVDDENGKVSSNGIYYTGPDGTITINGIVGTVTITEQATIPGYTIDPETRSQTIVVNPDDVQHAYFYNSPKNTLIIEKYLETESGNEPLKGVTFLVTDSSGAVIGNSNGEFITGDDGRVVIAGVEPGTTVNVQEIKVPEGVVLDSIPKSIKISDDGANILRFYNKKTGYLVVRKLDSITKQPLAGVEFELTYADGSYVDDAFGHLSSKGRFVTNDAGEIRVPVVGTIVVKEVKTLPTHVIDQATQIQTVKVNPADTQTITVYNEPLCSLTLRKLDAVTGKPVPNTEFTLKDGNGTVLGRYTTESDGTVTVTGLIPNSTIVVVETKVPANYVLDPTPRTIIVRNGSNSVASGGTSSGGTVSGGSTGTTGGGNAGTVGGGNDLTMENMPKTTLTIEKYLETDAGNVPLKGVTFLVTDSSGAILGPNNGEYTSDENGRIVLPNLEPGTVITAKELRVPDGVVLDPTPKSIEIKGGMGGQTLTFINKSAGGLELIKVNEADKSQRIPNVTFEIRRMDGGLVDTITTDKQGRAHLDLDAGDYYAVETEAGKGFKLDSTPVYFTIQDGKTTTLTVTNRAMSSILIHKIDSATKQGIYGVTFLLYDANKTPIGQYSSDDKGYVYIDDLPSSGRYYLRELENEGYLVDTQLKTVYVTDGTTTEITWENTAVTGQIQITKTSEDYNSMNGWPAGTPIPNTEFEIYHYRTGNLVDTIRTDKNGVAVSKPLPLGRYKIVESKAADFYGLDKTPIEVEIEHAGQIVKTAMTNKSLYTNVSIKKTGYTEVMPGQQIRYDFSGIANNSTTALTSFYWRDTLPVQAVRLDKIVTGTYNVQGNYKIVFKTNLNGEYRTMYDNLSTMQNYVLDASPAALGLTSNEYVTEFMVSFGIVPGNFRQVEAPKVYCNVVSWLTGGTQFVNQADVGGVYNGQWIMATSRWVTKVYKPSTPLPRTGY